MGAQVVIVAPGLLPLWHTPPAIWGAYLPSIRVHRFVLCLGCWGGTHSLDGREVEWDIIWPLGGHRSALWKEGTCARAPEGFSRGYRLNYTLKSM